MNLYLSSSTEGKAQRKREKQTGSSLCFFSLRFAQADALKNLKENNLAGSKSELQVITYAKKLSSYVMTITQKSPKQFRFSVIGKMQNYVLDIVEELYYANDIYVQPSSKSGWRTRQMHQRKALSTLKLLGYVSQLAMELHAIQPRQYEQISRQAFDVQNMLGAWIVSDSKRFMAAQQKIMESSPKQAL